MNDVAATQHVNGHVHRSYDPKAVWLEEWARVFDGNPIVRGGFTGEEAYDEIAEHAMPGTAIREIPIETYRLIATATAHSALALFHQKAAKDHASASDAFRTVALQILRPLEQKGKCYTFDPGAAVIRECIHSHAEEIKKARDAIRAGVVQVNGARAAEILKSLFDEES